MSLDPLDREMLVKLMSGFDEVDHTGRAFHPHSARARRLALSSLGALLDAEGNWEPPAPAAVGLEEWRHLATLGRDHYVRVVYRGFLKDVPARRLARQGDRAQVRIHCPTRKHRVAVLRQRFFIVVREPVKHYDGAGHEFCGRNFPVHRRRDPDARHAEPAGARRGGVSTERSGQHHLQPRQRPGWKAAGVPHRACFWPMISATNNFMFQIAATDLERQSGDLCACRCSSSAREANENPQGHRGDHQAEQLEPANPRRRASTRQRLRVLRADQGRRRGRPAPADERDDVPQRRRRPASPRTRRSSIPEIESAQVGIAAIQRLLQKPDATVGVTYPDCYNTTPAASARAIPASCS